MKANLYDTRPIVTYHMYDSTTQVRYDYGTKYFRNGEILLIIAVEAGLTEYRRQGWEEH